MELSVSLIILAFTGLVSYQAFSRPEMMAKFKHSPYREFSQKEWYRLLTSGFLHADWVHLLINMYMLYAFGGYVEKYIVQKYGSPTGHIIFLVFYMMNIILANIPTAFQHKHNPGFSSIGASGAISGIIFVFILLDPWQMFLFPPLPAVLLGIGYLIYSSWASNKGHGRIDHSAHFAGALAGMAMIILINHDIINVFLEKLVSDFPLK